MFESARVISCRDIDHAREALAEVFLPVDFPSARASGVVEMELNALMVGELTCGYLRFHDAVRIDTAEATDYHIDIPTNGRATMQAALGPLVHGSQDTAGIFMPGRPVEIDTAERFEQLSVMIPASTLQLELENLLDEELLRPLEFTAELDLDTPGARMMMRVLQMIDDASRHEGGPLAHALSTQRLEQVLMHTLLFAQQHNYSSALTAPSTSAGSRPVARAVEILRKEPEHPWTVRELAMQVAVSVRSLQEGFRRSLDTTPMAYLRRLRLERVHAELIAAAPGAVTVSEVALRWGFAHLGRFAAAYGDMYSELPSVTMRQHRQSPAPRGA